MVLPGEAHRIVIGVETHRPYPVDDGNPTVLLPQRNHRPAGRRALYRTHRTERPTGRPLGLVCVLQCLEDEATLGLD